MATNVSNLGPAGALELLSELSHFHQDNMKTGCDTGLKSSKSELRSLEDNLRTAWCRRAEVNVLRLENRTLVVMARIRQSEQQRGLPSGPRSGDIKKQCGAMCLTQ